MKSRSERRRRVDAGIETRRDPRIVHGVDLGPLLRDLQGNRRGKILEVLVGPDGSRGTPLDRAVPPAKVGIYRLQGRVGFFRRRGVQIAGFRIPRQDIEPRHWLSERRGAERRARRQLRRDAGRVRAPGQMG